MSFFSFPFLLTRRRYRHTFVLLWRCGLNGFFRVRSVDHYGFSYYHSFATLWDPRHYPCKAPWGRRRGCIWSAWFTSTLDTKVFGSCQFWRWERELRMFVCLRVSEISENEKEFEFESVKSDCVIWFLFIEEGNEVRFDLRLAIFCPLWGQLKAVETFSAHMREKNNHW